MEGGGRASLLYYCRLRASLSKEPQLMVSVSEVCQSKLNPLVRVNNCNNSQYEDPVLPITRWFEVTFCYLIEKKTHPPTCGFSSCLITDIFNHLLNLNLIKRTQKYIFILPWINMFYNSKIFQLISQISQIFPPGNN